MTRILSVAALFILAAVPALVAATDNQRQNNDHNQDHRNNCFTCPQFDTAGFPLGVNSNNNNVLFCSYPSVQGEDPNIFFCTYNDHDGTLIEDHDVRLCPLTADQVSCHHWREDSYGAITRRAIKKKTKA